MNPGTSIQMAVDLAQKGATIIVCAGLYPESVRISKEITLTGKPGAILDGSALAGTRYGILLVDGVKQFTLEGFEIRNYANALDANDLSAGIAAAGETKKVRIAGVNIHDNGFAGIVSGAGNATSWKIVDSTFAKNGFAHIMLQYANGVDILRDTFAAGARVPIALAGVLDAQVGNNAISGTGLAAISISPSLGAATRSSDAKLHHNVVRGNWTHGIWMVDAARSNVSGNDIEAQSALTIAGDPKEVKVKGKMRAGLERARPDSVVEAFRKGRPTDLHASIAYASAAPGCADLACMWRALWSWLPDILPTVRAQVPSNAPATVMKCGTSSDPSTCSRAFIAGTYDYAAGEVLNLGASPQDAADRARLAGCEARPDACLTGAFFPAGDVAVPREWNVSLGSGVELRFVDVGVRRPGEPLARHAIEASLDATYETLILCRLYVDGVPTSCAAAPRQIDFGLDQTWAETSLARHLSTWHLHLPDNGVHATFDRIHGPDATLFHATTRVHDAQSPPPVSTSAPAADPARTVYTGSATLQCRMLPTDDPANWTAGSTSCPSVPLVVQPIPTGFAWCAADAPNVREDAHATLASEIAIGYWAWSATCADLPAMKETSWDALLTPADRADMSAGHADDALVRALGRHLAKRLDGSGLPNAPRDGTVANASAFTVGPLEWDTGVRANLRLVGVDAIDRIRGWVPLGSTSQLSLSTAHVRLQADYVGANGVPSSTPLDLIVRGNDTTFPVPPLLVHSAGRLFGSAHASDPNEGIATHEFPLLNVTQGDRLLASGLFDVGFQTTSQEPIRLCAVDLATMRADGTRSNLQGQDRLALVDAARGDPCLDLSALGALDLRYFDALLTTLEIREGDVAQPQATFRVVGDPLALANGSIDLTRALTLSGAYDTASPVDTGVAAGTLRVQLTLPRLPRERTADALAGILAQVGPSVQVIAIEIPGLPAPRALSEAIERVEDQLGVVVLVPADALPPAGAALAPKDKLMTITGLAAHPRVLTIGGGSVRGGVDAASRLGPTPKLQPKPDFVAPGAGLSPIASVTNALPFVEAIALQGVRHVDLVRAVLASFATPIRGEKGGPATFYEQGYGALDLGYFLGLNSTPDLLSLAAARANRSVDAITHDTANALGATDDAVRHAEPGALVGVVSDPAPLLRAAVTATLLHLALDSPAFPRELEVDFGVVNHDLPGEAAFTPLDYDAVLNTTMGRFRALLQGTGVTATRVDDIVGELQGLVDVSVREGQDVTLNATHYAFFDALSGDLLYTLYADLSEQAYSDTPALQTADVRGALDATLGPIQRWKLQPHYLTEERSGHATLDAHLDTDCMNIPVDGIESLADTTLAILHHESSGLALGPAGDPVARFRGALPESYHEFVSKDNAAFVHDEATQLVCLEDAKAVLRMLLNDTRALEVLARAPPGALDEGEAWSGAFDRTVLGGQMNHTLVAAGVEPATVARSSSLLVLDQTAEILSRAIAKLDSTLGFLGIPNVTGHEIGGPRTLKTLPQRTSDLAKNPLGLYVGLARMTSRDISLRNPLSGEVLLSRNVTIPLPSFLWNNPTLDATLAYRDGTPLERTELLLHHQMARVFGSITSDLSVTQDGLTIPLVAQNAEHVRAQRDDVAARLAAVQDALGTSGLLGLPPGYGEKLNDTLRAFAAELQARLHALDASLASAHVDDRVDTQSTLAPMVESMVTSLVSRLKYQMVLSGDDGHASVPNLFPGTYAKFFPYPYALMTELDRDYAPHAPGYGGLAGPMNDTNLEINRLARATVRGLSQLGAEALDTRADDVASDSGCVAPCTGAYPFFEIDGGTTPDLHSFGLRLKGPDVFGALCGLLNGLDQKTASGVTLPGCGSLALDANLSIALQGIDDVLACARGLGAPSLTDDARALCSEYATGVARDHEACAIGEDLAACATEGRNAPFLGGLERLVALLDVTRSNGDAAIAPPHSPLRAILDSPTETGFTVTGLLPAARAANPGVDDARLSSAIEKALTALRNGLDPLRPNLTVTPPPAVSRVTFTEPQGILGHVTDKITGNDWTHVDAGALPRSAGTNDELTQALGDVATLVVNGTDQALLQMFMADVRSNDALGPFNAGLANAPRIRAEGLARGWGANGVTSTEGLRLAPSSSVERRTKDQACAGASAATGLPPSYFTCSDLAVVGTAADIRGPAGIDKVAFVNSLMEQIHEAARDHATVSYRSLLENATAWAATPSGSNWSRTTDAIRLTSTVNASNLLPAVGALLYSTPVPAQEYMTYRFDAEILAQNTGALLITTGNGDWAKVIMDLVQTLNVTQLTSGVAAPGGSPPPPDDALASLRLADNITRILSGGTGITRADPLFRIDPIGFPVALDDHIHTGTTPAKACILCKSGLLAVRPDGYYEYSREYEFNTLGSPVERLYAILLYFPSTTRLGDLSQELLLRNASLQMETYLGIDASPGNGAVWDVPLRYSPRVEDHKLLIAIPMGRASGLSVTAASSSSAPITYAPVPDDFVAAASPRWAESACSKTVAPGYGPNIGARARGVGSSEFLYAAESDKCLTDRIVALQPRVVTTKLVNITNWTTSVPEKRITDALGYTFNVDGIAQEQMTHAGKMELATYCNVLCDPVSTAIDAARIPAATSDLDAAVAIARSQIAFAQAAAAGTRDPARETLRSLIDVPIPFSTPSFLREAQHGEQAQARSGSAHHEYFVLNETNARALILRGGDTSLAGDPTWRLRITEGSTPPGLAPVPTKTTVQGQYVPIHPPDPDFRALVATHSYGLMVEQPEGAVGQDVGQAASVLVANGISGTGVGVEVLQPVVLRAGDKSPYFSEGLRASAAAGLNVRVFVLGGSRTSDALCQTVPGYELIRPYFRCTGVATVSTFAGVAGSAEDRGCFTRALSLLVHSRDDALLGALAATDATGDMSDETRALFEGALTAPPPVPLDAARTQRRIGEASAAHQALIADAVAVATCFSASAVPLVGTNALGILAEAATLATQGEIGNATLKTRASVGLVDADLALHGEPARLITPLLTLSGGATSLNGYVNRPDAVNVDALLAEWSTHAKTAFLNVTSTPRGGAPSTTTLAALPKASQLSLMTPLPSRLSGAAAAWDDGRRVAYVFHGTNVSRYDPATGQLTTLRAKLDVARDGPAAVWAAPYAYVAGGGSPNVLRYDPRDDSISVVASAPGFARAQGGAYTDGARLYFMGGRIGSTYTNVTDVYAFANRTAYTIPGGSPPRHEFALAYDGKNAYLMGGRSAGDPRGEIFRLTPGTGDVLPMGGRLPGTHVRESGFYDGRYLYAVGASAAPDRIMRYDPLVDLVVELPAAEIPAGLGAIAAVSDRAGHAWLLGGSDTAPKDTIYAFDPTLPLPVNAPATYAIRVEPGGAYTVSLEARDEYGGTFRTALSFASDATRPTIASPLAALTWARSALGLQWTVGDDESGVASVAIKQRALGTVGPWIDWPAASDPTLGGRGPYEIARTLAPGADTEVSVTVTDRAGNANTTTYAARFDMLPPDLVGTFDDVKNGWITSETLRTSTRAWDNLSGLRDVSVWLVNRTEERQIPLGNVSTLSWHTTSTDNAFWLKLYANDTVGNAATFVGNLSNRGYGFDLIAPAISSARPNLTTQGVVRGILLTPNVVGPASRFPADRLLVNVTSVATGAIVFRANISRPNGTYPTYWAPGGDGAYDVSYDAVSSQAHRKMSARLNVKMAPGDLTDYETYGQLNGSGAADLYRVKALANGCSATAVLYSLDGSEVALDFRPTTGPDTLPYSTHDVTTTSVRRPLSMGPSDAALKVSHAGASDSPYAVILDINCNGASNQPPAPPQPPPEYVTDRPPLEMRS